MDAVVEITSERPSIDQLLERIVEQDRKLADLTRRLDALGEPGEHTAALDDQTARATSTRRDVMRGAAIAVGAAITATVVHATPVAADAQATGSGPSTVNFGVYASPNGVARPAVGNPNKIGVIGYSDTAALAPNVGAPVGVYGASGTGYGVVAETETGYAAMSVVTHSPQGSGIEASAAGGVAVRGQSVQGIGVTGRSESGNGVIGESTSQNGVVGTSTTGSGVNGYSSDGSGVSGGSGQSVGGLFRGGAGAIRLMALAGPPPGRSSTGTVGTIDVDTDGTVWSCVAAGTPGTWRELAGAHSAGQFHALVPGRVYDSRNAAPAGLVGRIASGDIRTISIADRRAFATGEVELADFVPAGATAVTANVTVVDTTQAGFLTVNPGGVTTATTAAINWSATGQILNNGQNLTVDDARKVTVVCGGGGDTHVVIDVTGYYR